MTPRPMRGSDDGWATALNAREVERLSPLDEAGMARLREAAALALAIDPQAGFLLAFEPGADYASPNFLWFRERAPRFLYVDRIAVDPGFRRRGAARALYAAVFSEAERLGAPVCCEVNSRPPNPGSDAFHAALGFREAGRAEHGPDKAVRYLIRE